MDNRPYINLNFRSTERIPDTIQDMHSAVLDLTDRLDKLPPDSKKIEVIRCPFGRSNQGWLDFAVGIDSCGSITSGYIDFTTKDKIDDFHIKSISGRPQDVKSIIRHLDYHQPIDNTSYKLRELAAMDKPNGADLTKILEEISLEQSIRTIKTYSYQDIRVTPSGAIETGAQLKTTLDFIDGLPYKTSINLSLPYEIDNTPTEINCGILSDESSIYLFKTSYIDINGREIKLTIEDPSELAELILILMKVSIEEHAK